MFHILSLLFSFHILVTLKDIWKKKKKNIGSEVLSKKLSKKNTHTHTHTHTHRNKLYPRNKLRVVQECKECLHGGPWIGCRKPIIFFPLWRPVHLRKASRLHNPYNYCLRRPCNHAVATTVQRLTSLRLHLLISVDHGEETSVIMMHPRGHRTLLPSS